MSLISDYFEKMETYKRLRNNSNLKQDAMHARQSLADTIAAMAQRLKSAGCELMTTAPDWYDAVRTSHPFAQPHGQSRAEHVHVLRVLRTSEDGEVSQHDVKVQARMGANYRTVEFSMEVKADNYLEDEESEEAVEAVEKAMRLLASSDYFLVIQHPGSSSEPWRPVTFDDEDAANEFRKSAAEASYTTSAPIALTGGDDDVARLVEAMRDVGFSYPD